MTETDTPEEVQEAPKERTLADRQRLAVAAFNNFQATIEAELGMTVVPVSETKTFTNNGEILVQTTLTLRVQPTR
jgi:hypothetical protein